MAKRFIETGLFDDEWFMDLSKDGKILWIYILTKCNHAGIIQLNPKLCLLQTGIKDYVTVIKELGNRCITVKEHLYFIPKFIVFQYPGFPQSKVRQQQSAVYELEKYGLFNNGQITIPKELLNSSTTVIDSYDNDTGNGIVIKAQIQKNHLFKDDEFSDFEKFRNEFKDGEFKDADLKYYFDSFMDWSNSKGEKKIDWIATIRNGMRKDLKENKLRKSMSIQNTTTGNLLTCRNLDKIEHVR